VSRPATTTTLNRIHVRLRTYRDSAATERAGYAARLRELPADERVLLETCHRVELITVGGEAAGAPADGGGATQLSGQHAVRRVFEVVAGFDSAVLAEEQLLGQARSAYETALERNETGPILNELVRRALRFGRLVRSHALPGADRSLADRTVGWLATRLTSGEHVLVVGTGEMGRLSAIALARGGHRVTVVSRSAERARRVVDVLPGAGHRLHAGALDASAVGSAAAVVLAVRTRDPIVTAAHLSNEHQPWVVDLSTPPAVADDAVATLGDRLLSLDRGDPLGDATPVLDERTERRLRSRLEIEVDRFAGWLQSRQSTDAVTLLRSEADAVRRRHVDRLRRQARLRPEQVAAVEAASTAMLNELLHRPTVELRSGGADAAAVRRLFGIDPA
jgi:glutamyl-tRNA reductase